MALTLSSQKFKIQNQTPFYTNRFVNHSSQIYTLSSNFFPFTIFAMSFSSSSSLKNPVFVPNGSDQRGHNHLPPGEIHVIFGPMFAGKTTALLRLVNSESKLGRNVVMIKSNKDTRYAVDAVVTHDGTKFPCWSLPDLSSFKHRFGPEAYEKVDVIGIDEAQFFDDLYDFCCNAADIDGKIVIVAGLDGDYLRRKFGSVLDIIPIADTVTKLTARCELCGKRAFFTLRKTDEMQKELIGGASMYMPVCRQHYVNGKSIMESAKKVLESHQVQVELVPEKPLVA